MIYNSCKRQIESRALFYICDSVELKVFCANKMDVSNKKCVKDLADFRYLVGSTYSFECISFEIPKSLSKQEYSGIWAVKNRDFVT